MDKKVSAFFVGNLVGLSILVGGILLTLPKKLKETEIIEKQKVASTEGSASSKNLAPYVVASRNLTRGQQLVAADMHLELMPQSEHPDGLSELKNLIGKTTTAEITKGATITAKVIQQ